MKNNFKDYIELVEYVETHGAILVPENFAWAKAIGTKLPDIDLGLPKVEKRAKIDILMDKKNPIYMQLSDGSKLFFTFDEFKRIDGKPERGKTMVVTMQRLGHDSSDLPSQIVKCQVI
jgi:hypothetical protein